MIIAGTLSQSVLLLLAIVSSDLERHPICTNIWALYLEGTVRRKQPPEEFIITWHRREPKEKVCRHINTASLKQ